MWLVGGFVGYIWEIEDSGKRYDRVVGGRLE
jgi:hypothetical protein